MASSILITATKRHSGKSALALGIIHLLGSTFSRVGYFKPVGRCGTECIDPDVRLMKEALGLDFSLEEMSAVTMEQVQEALSNGTYDQLLETILDAFMKLSAKCDFVVCEGTDFCCSTSAFEFNINADLSKNLGAAVLHVANGEECSCSSSGPSVGCRTLKSVSLVKESLIARGCEMAGVVINRVNPEKVKEIRETAAAYCEKRGITLLGVVPHTDNLGKPRVEEVAEALGAEVLTGHDHLNVVVQDVLVAAAGVENLLDQVKRASLVVVPSDRSDALLWLACAFASPSVPAPAGVIMTGGMEPGKNVKRLVLDVTGGQMPVLKVSMDAYEAANISKKTQPSLEAQNKLRVELVQTIIESSVDVKPLVQRATAQTASRKTTPKQFIHRMMDIARRDKRHIVLPEGKEPRILRAASLLLERGIVDLTLLGNEAEIWQQIGAMGLKFEGLKIIDPTTSALREKFAERYMELRAKKNPTRERAFELMGDVTYFGTMMVQEGISHGMVSGSITTTAETLRPALEFVKTKPGCSIASSCFFMCLPDQVLVYGDCAVNPNPTSEQLADIAIASAETAASFDVEPYVAMLSYSTGASGTGADVEKVRSAVAIVKERKPDLLVEGPIQYDAAVDAGVAKTKLPGSKVAGAATVFVFPDLNAGNIGYKAVQRVANATAIGPVMQGLRKPVNDLSRGCTIPDIINTIVITAIQAQRS